MIVGSLAHGFNECQIAHPVLRKAIGYLANTDFSQMEDGKYPIWGDEMYALLMTISSKSATEQPAEKHEVYLDIHFLLEGDETIGWQLDDGTEAPTLGYDSEKDFALYAAPKEETLIKMKPGMYMVLFPEDLHRPGLSDAAPSQIRKVVIKIRQDLF